MQQADTFSVFRVIDFSCSFLVGTGRAAFLQTIARCLAGPSTSYLLSPVTLILALPAGPRAQQLA